MALLPGDHKDELGPVPVVDEAHQIELLKERVTELEKRLDLNDVKWNRLRELLKNGGKIDV